MLKTLSIKNYALIDVMVVEFGPGLNILTGETGAGKSIILGALSMLLGERVKTDVIRQGSSIAVVEGLFEKEVLSHLTDFKDQIDFGEDGLLLRREVHQSGRTRSFANDSPISNSLLAEIGDRLIDLHGQHAHQSLLKVDQHLEVLDNFGVDQTLRNQVKASYKKVKQIRAELEKLNRKEKELREKRELLEFQVQDIAKVDPTLGEEDELEQEERILRNSEKLFQASMLINDLLYDGEGSVSEKLSLAHDVLTDIADVDVVFKNWIKECETARISAEEIATAFQTYVSKIEFNPQRLEEVRERLGLLSVLKKKYGGTIEQVIQFLEYGKKELEQIETLGDDIERLNTEWIAENRELTRLCEALSKNRKTIGSDLEKRTIESLGELGLKNGIFKIVMTLNENPNGWIRINNKPVSVSERGVDRVEFIISLNPGEKPKPLNSVASGGEISRIMLALKTVLAEADAIPVLVFDEIDTGISGRIARVVGKNLKDVSGKHQVICITHLPQIASISDIHYRVEKKVKDERSHTTIRRLNEKERVMEIAKLIGGEKVTESALQSARELLEE
ncbi:DNA repair protein RecN [bacterium]|nr:DNA repair protein RecN [bacterium]